MHISKYITKKALSNKLTHRNNSLSFTKSTGRQTMSRSINSRFSTLQNGFTIVELLVVIVVIGILAAITIVSYTGITNRAKLISVQSDLSNDLSLLKVYQAINGSFPATFDGNNCPLLPVPDTTNCLKKSSDNKLAYTPAIGTAPQDFRMTASDATTTNNYSTNANSINCPLNFIVVPGSLTYGTKDFCVMKYEAKQDGSSTTPISMAAGLPWTTISQTTAITNSANVASCNNCHLITEAEWMTISQNVLSVPSNWSSGTVGTGYIYSGHNDSSAAALEASTDDTLGYTGTGNSSGSGPEQKRTLTLTNGEVIWDLAGNVWEWTGGQTTGGQPGVAGNAYNSWIQWPNVTTPGTLSPSVFPSGTGITGSSTWTSTQGIGQLLSNPAETGLRGFVRGGAWGSGGSAGVLALYLYTGPGPADAGLGFRVSR